MDYPKCVFWLLWGARAVRLLAHVICSLTASLRRYRTLTVSVVEFQQIRCRAHASAFPVVKCVLRHGIYVVPVPGRCGAAVVKWSTLSIYSKFTQLQRLSFAHFPASKTYAAPAPVVESVAIMAQAILAEGHFVQGKHCSRVLCRLLFGVFAVSFASLSAEPSHGSQRMVPHGSSFRMAAGDPRPPSTVAAVAFSQSECSSLRTTGSSGTLETVQGCNSCASQVPKPRMSPDAAREKAQSSVARLE